MEAHEGFKEFVVQFPALAAWLLVALGSAFVLLIGFGGRVFLRRLDRQDKTMEDIKVLLTSETATLRTMLHDQDVRIVRIEERCLVQHNGH